MAQVGGTTRIQLLAITGLGVSQVGPFVRLFHTDVIAKKHQGPPHAMRNAGTVSIELPDGEYRPQNLQRTHRHRYSEFMACWGEPGSNDANGCVVYLPYEVDLVEVQVWNQFGDVSAFLGVTTISLRHLRRGLPATCDDRGANPLTMWFPMNVSESTGNNSKLSVKLSISFQTFDDRTRRLQQQIKHNRHRRENGGQPNVPAPVAVEPSFQFTEPNARIEWSSIVAANVRRMFVCGDVEELQLFRNDVMFGDVEKEIEDDEDIVVDEGHLLAFRLCQLSTQYLYHCVSILERRSTEYEQHRRVMTATKKEKRRERMRLGDQKRRLEKELCSMDVLVTAYEKLMAQHNTTTVLPVDRPSVVSSQLAQSPIQQTPQISSDDLVSKKPAFLMTWEEREQARKNQKELDKAQRIQSEKTRLLRLFQDRQHNEKLEEGLANIARRRKERAFVKLQQLARQFVRSRRDRRFRTYQQAAAIIQKHFRCFSCVKAWSQLRPRLLSERESRCMLLCDEESKLMRESHRESENEHARVQSDNDLFSDEGNEHTSLEKHVSALELITGWKKLKNIFEKACQKGASIDSIFSTMDTRGDGVIDRAEFRTGVRHFGLRINRKMARALVALVRAKCGAPMKPLVIDKDQFVRGFDIRVRGRQSRPDSAGYKPSIQAIPADVHVQEREIKDELTATGFDEDVSENRDTCRTIEDVADAVATLRRRVLDATSDHLAAQGKSVTDYFTFREALTHVFQEFDADGNGELDLHELVQCMAAINFQVTPENLSIVRECFVADPSSPNISIAEFISFVMCGMRAATNLATQRDEELGVMGYNLREAILGKVKHARSQANSIEDAVRLVFTGAYRSNKQLSCSRQDMAQVLASLRLGFTAAQLSRLVLRLDRDGDGSISFEELLIWLRLRVSDLSPSKSNETATTSTITKRRNVVGRTTAMDRVDFVRNILLELAGVDANKNVPRKRAVGLVTSLFRRIDTNASGKINAYELRAFLVTCDLDCLEAVSITDDIECVLADVPRLAKQIVRIIDLNGNGVITQEEWIGFLMNDPSDQCGGSAVRGDLYAVIEGVRQTMRDTFPDDTSLLGWFRSIAGAILQSPTSEQVKVRTGEFKSAVRSKFPFISASDADQTLKVLDADGSGWITEKELMMWQFPTRDLEEVVIVVERAWAAEAGRQRQPSYDTYVEALYCRFDPDRNGLIARKELRDGLLGFKIHLNDEETAGLMTKFDIDGDGFWSKSDFTACVRQLVPRIEIDDDQGNDTTPALDDEEAYQSSGFSGNESEPIEASDANRSKRAPDKLHDRDVYADDFDAEEDSSSSLGYSIDGLSPLAMSPVVYDTASVSQAVSHPATVEYSEDFDEVA